jgi:hypothetical protein
MHECQLVSWCSWEMSASASSLIEPLASVASLVPDLGEMFGVAGDLTFVQAIRIAPPSEKYLARPPMTCERPR